MYSFCYLTDYLFQNITFHVQHFYFINIWLSCRMLQICSFSFWFEYILFLKNLCFSLCTVLPFSPFSLGIKNPLLFSKIVLMSLKCLLIFLCMANFISLKRKETTDGLPINSGWVKLTILASLGLMLTGPLFRLSQSAFWSLNSV